MTQTTVEFELLGIPVCFNAEYFKEKIKKCCDDREEYFDYLLGVGFGFGVSKNAQKNYNNAVKKIRIELLNTLLSDPNSIFKNSSIEKGYFSKSDERLNTIISFSLKKFKERYSCIDFKENEECITIFVLEKGNLFTLFGRKKEIKGTIEINKNEVELLFGKHFDSQFMIKTKKTNYIFKNGEIYGATF